MYFQRIQLWKTAETQQCIHYSHTVNRHGIYSIWIQWNEHLILLLFMSMEWDYVSELKPTWYMRIHEHGEQRWNDIDRWNRRRRIKPCPRATLSTTNPACNDPGANPVLRGEMPATNHLSQDTNWHLIVTIVTNLSLFMSLLLFHTSERFPILDAAYSAPIVCSTFSVLQWFWNFQKLE
jgi:hypothetical protein